MQFMTKSDTPSEVKAARAFIDRETLVPVSVVFAVLMAMFGAFTWMNSQFETINVSQRNNYSELRDNLKDFSYRIKTLEDKVGAPQNAWDDNDMRLFLARLKAENPALNIPTPEYAK